MKRFVSALALLASFSFFFACSDDHQLDTESGEASSLSASPSDAKASIVLVNKCSETIKVGRMGHGDFATLKKGQSVERVMGSDKGFYPSIAYYGYRVGKHPAFGNMSLAELTLNPNGQKIDYYDVSYVDGFNVPITIRSRLNKSCKVAGCTKGLNPGCPAGNRIVRNGVTIACSKFGDKDNPNNAAARYFERECKQAYSWSKDDGATKGCNGQDYVVTFCG